MSELGQSRPKRGVRAMSAIPPIATELRTSRHVSKVPKPESYTVTREAYSITASARPSNGRDDAAGHGRSTSARSASRA